MSQRTSMANVTVAAIIALALGVMAASPLSAQIERPDDSIPIRDSKDAADTTDPADSDSEIRKAVVRFETFNGVEIDFAENGHLVITEVKPKRDAARTGVEKGDEIIEINGRKLKSRRDAVDALTTFETQKYHIVKLKRGDEQIEVILGEHLDVLGMLIVPDRSARPVVHRVESGSPADQAGVRTDDIIVGVSGRKIDTLGQFNEFVVPLIRKMSPGQELNIRMIRETDEVEFAIIRPEVVNLPLLAALHESSRERTIEKSGRIQREQPDQFLTEVTNLPQDAPSVGFGGFATNGAALATAPRSNTVVAVLHPTRDAFQRGRGDFDRDRRLGNDFPNTTPADDAPDELVPRTGRDGRPLPGTRRRTDRVPQGGTQPATPGESLTPNTDAQNFPPVDDQPGNVRRGQGIRSRTSVQPGVGTRQPGVRTRTPVRDQDESHFPGSEFSQFRRVGFVMVGIDEASNQNIVHARVMGLQPGFYRLAVHQFGDCGDPSQNSAGPIVAVLGTFRTDNGGRAEIRQVINASIDPAQLVGRAVSVISGSHRDGVDDRGAATSDVIRRRDVPLTDDRGQNVPSVIEDRRRANDPPVSDQDDPRRMEISEACGVFGFASLHRPGLTGPTTDPGVSP